MMMTRHMLRDTRVPIERMMRGREGMKGGERKKITEKSRQRRG